MKVDEAFTAIQQRKALRPWSHPLFITPTTKIRTMRAGIIHCATFPPMPFGGIAVMSEVSSVSSPFSSFSRVLIIPWVWPAPMTATFDFPSALKIDVARYLSLSSMSTSFTEGSSLATSFSIDSRVSSFLSSASSSSLISSLEKAAETRVARSLHLFHRLLFPQALRKVVWISLSQRDTGIPISSASFAAPRISAPGSVPVWAPILF